MLKSNILRAFIATVVFAFTVGFVAAPALAASSSYDSYDLSDYDWSYDSSYSSSEADALSALISIPMMILNTCVGLFSYIYMSLTIMTTGKKLGTPNEWMAWIPVLNIYYLVKMAGLSGAWTFGLLLLFIPCLGWLALYVGAAYIYYKIAEKRGFPAWLGLLMVIPLIRYFIAGYLAWGEPSK